jgi:hypothetical protein
LLISLRLKANENKSCLTSAPSDGSWLGPAGARRERQMLRLNDIALTSSRRPP